MLAYIFSRPVYTVSPCDQCSGFRVIDQTSLSRARYLSFLGERLALCYLLQVLKGQHPCLVLRYCRDLPKTTLWVTSLNGFKATSVNRSTGWHVAFVPGFDVRLCAMTLKTCRPICLDLYYNFIDNEGLINITQKNYRLSPLITHSTHPTPEISKTNYVNHKLSKWKV